MERGEAFASIPGPIDRLVNGAIRRAPANQQRLPPLGIAVDSKYVYWTNAINSTGTVMKVAK